MGTTLIKNRQNGGDLAKLTSDQQRMFCLYMMASEEYHPTEAAKLAGFKNAKQAAYRLLHNKRVLAILGRFKREREERTKITSDQIWEYLYDVLAFNPLKLFHPEEDGWYITDLKEIPDEVGVLIEEVQVEETPLKDGGVQRRLRVKLVSKTAALGIAARHSIPQEHNVKITKVDWDTLSGNGEKEVDPYGIEERLAREGK